MSTGWQRGNPSARQAMIVLAINTIILTIALALVMVIGP
jgi:hypothetical protein